MRFLIIVVILVIFFFTIYYFLKNSSNLQSESNESFTNENKYSSVEDIKSNLKWDEYSIKLLDKLIAKFGYPDLINKEKGGSASWIYNPFYNPNGKILIVDNYYLSSAEKVIHSRITSSGNPPSINILIDQKNINKNREIINPSETLENDLTAFEL